MAGLPLYRSITEKQTFFVYLLYFKWFYIYYQFRKPLPFVSMEITGPVRFFKRRCASEKI